MIFALGFVLGLLVGMLGPIALGWTRLAFKTPTVNYTSPAPPTRPWSSLTPREQRRLGRRYKKIMEGRA